MSTVSLRVVLSRMEAARRETAGHLDLIQRQIAGRAERITVTEKAKAHNRSHKRSGSRWSRSDEMLYQAHLERLTFERRVELDGLVRKLARQEQAIDRMRRKLGEIAGRKAA
jgi:hypothetical protein